MQILRPYSRPIESESLGWDLANHVLMSPQVIPKSLEIENLRSRMGRNNEHRGPNVHRVPTVHRARDTFILTLGTNSIILQVKRCRLELPRLAHPHVAA